MIQGKNKNSTKTDRKNYAVKACSFIKIICINNHRVKQITLYRYSDDCIMLQKWKYTLFMYNNLFF